MAWISSDIKIGDAISRGMPVWEVLYDNWGNAIAGAGANTAFPALDTPSLPTVYGVSIGPRSTVDRAFVAYDRQKVVSSSYDYLRQVSVGAPLTFAQPAAPTANVVGNLAAAPFSASSVAVFNTPLISAVIGLSGFAFTTFRDSLGSTTSFGTLTLIKPLLHLYFHLKPEFVPPAARAPSIVSRQFLVGAPRELIASVPVCGRKRVFVTAVITNSGCVFDVGLVQQTNGTAPAASEVLVGTTTTTINNQPVRIVIDPAGADFVNIYATAGGGGTNGWWAVRAED